MMKNMLNDLIHMFNTKKDAVNRIALESERLASEYIYGTVTSLILPKN